MAGTKQRPICFIAMAFDHEDTDYLYEKQILPVLKRNGIKPVIINRQENNDDLNIQIIEQLKNADFCITDLTYTRPSVYFEAGYAQATMSDNVIYTVRKDHLHSGQPDNLRVHFDLQMKPIIAWKTQQDPTFSNRLEKRIQKTFLRAWKKNQADRSKLNNAISAFNALPLRQRLTEIRQYVIEKLRSFGFSITSWGDGKLYFSRYPLYESSSSEKDDYNYTSAHKILNQVANFVSVQSFLSITKKDVFFLHELLPIRDIVERLEDKSNNTILKSIYMYHFFMSIRPIQEARIADMYENYSPMSNPLRFQIRFPIQSKHKGKKIQVTNTYIFLGGIKSLIHLHQQAKELEQQIVRFI